MREMSFKQTQAQTFEETTPLQLSLEILLKLFLWEF